MTHEDVAEIINGIEEKFPVEKWVINKIHIWPIIRINLFMNFTYGYVHVHSQYSQKKYFINIISRALSLLLSFPRFIFAYLFDCKKNFTLKRCDVIFLSDGISFSKIKGCWFDKFCDPLIDYFRKNNIASFLMTPYSNYFIPRYNPSKFVQPFIDLHMIVSKVSSQFTHAKNEHLPDFSQFCKFLETNYFDPGRITLSIVRKRVAHIRIIANYFKKILMKAKPMVGFVVAYYGIEGFAFNLACREFGIPSVDIQHGYQGDLHLAYCRWHKIPNAGYELLPSFFWCWSDFEVSIIKKCVGLFSHFHKPITGGNLWLNQCLIGDSPFIKDYDKIIIEFKELYKYKNHILYTQSMGINNEYFKNILKVIRNSPDTWFWWIRIHPCELKTKPELIKVLDGSGISNYNIHYATTMPLYALLRHMDIHVTTLSAAVLEAESFGVPSVITHPAGNEYFSNQVSSEFLLSAYTPEDILQAIRFQLKKDTIKINRKINDEQYFDALQFLVSPIKQ